MTPIFPLLRLLLLLSLTMLQACGGSGSSSDSGSAPPPISPQPSTDVNIDTIATASGGNESSRVSVWEATIDGPQFNLSTASNIQVCATGTWIQQLSGGGTVDIRTTSLAPVELPARLGVGIDAFGVLSSISLTFNQCDTHALASGPHQLRYRVRVDCGAQCLSSYSTSLRWRVKQAI
jgi:hypothetical protein